MLPSGKQLDTPSVDPVASPGLGLELRDCFRNDADAGDGGEEDDSWVG
jgi:hypothetical protein